MNQPEKQIPQTPLQRLRLLRQVVRDEAAALDRLASQIGMDAVEAAQRIADCRGAVLVTGVGKAGLVGQKLVATLASTGNRAHFMHPSEAIHGDLGRLGPDDLVLAISNSGRSEEVVKIAPQLRRHSSGLVAMTATADNPLATIADIAVVIGRHPEADPLGLAPTTSSTAMMACGDAIAMLASRLAGFTSGDFARLHPGGSLGHQLSPVNRLMRPLDQCRIASAHDSVRQAMIAGAGSPRRTGAVMLLDDDRRLVGLFTDSDLARLLQQRRDEALDRGVAEVLTTQFQRVSAGTLLIDAIEVLKGCRISELPVVDPADRPLGLLDITDVIAATSIGQPQQAASSPSSATIPFSPRQLARKGRGAAGA